MKERLLIPQIIHGSVGEEMNVCFANVYAVLNFASYAFHFQSPRGSCCDERLRKKTPFAESDITLFRPGNALHPSPAGYRQMGSAAFSWLLDILENHLK